MRTPTVIIFICGSISGILIFRVIRRSGYDVLETIKDVTGPRSELFSSSEIISLHDKTPEELIEIFREKLYVTSDSNQNYKEMLQFLCAKMVIKIHHDEVFSLLEEALERREMEGPNYFESVDIRKRLLKVNVSKHDFAQGMAKLHMLLQEYDQTKVAQILMYFHEDKYFSVKEMLSRASEDDLFSKALAHVVNEFLKAITNTHIQWKWVNKEKNTVFPLVTTDSCKVPHI